MGKAGKTRLDKRGRRTLAKKPREELAFAPGDPVWVEKSGDGVVVRRVVSGEEPFRKLRGIITVRNAVGKLNPMELKKLLRAND